MSQTGAGKAMAVNQIKDANMKLKTTVALTLQLAFLTSVYAESIVQTPTGRLTAGLPVPIVIKLDQPSKEQNIEITSGGQRILFITKSEGIKISQISTRFQGISKEVATTITYKDGLKEQLNSVLDLPFTSSVPDDQESKKSEMGGGKVFEFTRRGTEYQLRKGAGVFGIFVKNAASMKHYVNSVVIAFPTDSGTSNITVSGSPYWFEPLVIFNGDFKEPSVLEVISD